MRALLPTAAWRWLVRTQWDSFWREEEESQARLLPQLPETKLRGSERAVLVEAIVESAVARPRILEVGCAYGQTFHILAPLLPRASFVGVDSNEAMVTEGESLLRERQISNVRLVTGDGVDLSRFGDGSFDTVYSIACLLYVPEAEIRQVLGEMIRLTRCRLFLLEQDTPGFEPSEVSRPGGNYWLRDYCKYLAEIAPNSQITRQKVENPLWSAERWKELATLVTLTKR